MKKLISAVTVLMLLLGLTTTVGAISQTVNVKLSLSKSTAKVGDEITVTADFKEDVEAVDQVLTYDSSKVEFIEVTTGGKEVGAVYFNADTKGVVRLSWATGDSTKTVEYKFKVLKAEEAKFSAVTEALADANVESPEKIVDGSVTLNKQTTPKPTTNNNTVSNNTTTEKPANNTATSRPTNNTTTSKPTNTTTSKPTNSTSSTSKPTTSTNKKPTSIPQAGVNVADYAIVALFAIVVIASIVAVVKFRKNK